MGSRGVQRVPPDTKMKDVPKSLVDRVDEIERLEGYILRKYLLECDQFEYFTDFIRAAELHPELGGISKASLSHYIHLNRRPSLTFAYNVIVLTRRSVRDFYADVCSELDAIETLSREVGLPFKAELSDLAVQWKSRLNEDSIFSGCSNYGEYVNMARNIAQKILEEPNPSWQELRQLLKNKKS